jgi:hypothetical protein
VEVLDAHLDEAGDRARGVVGVDGREHQVARERRVHGDLGGLLVADLAHHDHVRVLPEEGAEARREGEPDLGVHLHLREPAMSYSIGSSAVRMLMSGLLILLRHA